MRKRITASAAALALAAIAAAGLGAAPTEGEARKRIVETAVSFQGVPYVYGSESPEAFDCSGFVQYVYLHAADIEIPRNSKGQYAAGAPVDRSAAKPGDIFVFDTVGGSPSHVAIYLGGDSIIHAVSEGPKTGVVVSPVGDSYFGPRFMGARYFIASAVPGVPKGAAPKSASAVPTKAGAKPSPAKADAAPAVNASAANVATKPGVAAAAPNEPPLAQIGFTLRSTPEVVNDKIPAETGTAIAFTIANGTGKDDVFHIYFYKADVDFSKTRILREERAAIQAGASLEIRAFTFTEPGVYRLNVKTGDNSQLMQRTWKVVGPGQKP
jgi:hypothetical protein